VEKPPVTLDESVNGIVKVVKEARKDTHNGIFWDLSLHHFQVDPVKSQKIPLWVSFLASLTTLTIPLTTVSPAAWDPIHE
jgi:hypothetical protein